MVRTVGAAALAVCLGAFVPGALGQAGAAARSDAAGPGGGTSGNDHYQALKRNVDAFSAVLEQALELDVGGGPFFLGGERIDSMYLAGHGLVLEIRSDLASDRSRLNLAQLSSSVMALRQGDNPFALIARANQNRWGPLEQAENRQPSIEPDRQHPRFEMLARAREIDTSELVESVLAQAGDYAGILREADGVDAAAFDRLRAEIEALRRENRAGVSRLRELTEALRADAAEQSARFEQSLAEMAEEMRELRVRAEGLAAGLRERSESAHAERAARWREDVAEFELKLTAAMCDHGASLRELPDDEDVVVILSGLGDEISGTGRTDLVHNFGGADLRRCAAGEIDSVALGELSNRYSY